MKGFILCTIDDFYNLLDDLSARYCTNKWTVFCRLVYGRHTLSIHKFISLITYNWLSQPNGCCFKQVKI